MSGRAGGAWRNVLARFMADHIAEKVSHGWPREPCRCILCDDARAAGVTDAEALAFAPGLTPTRETPTPESKP